MSHTPGPWMIGSLIGQHLANGEEKCRLCRPDIPLLRVDDLPTPFPEKWTTTVHQHFSAGEHGEPYPGFRQIVAGDGTQIIGQYELESGGVCTGWDDARLIAAAPRLLEAARRAFDKLKAQDIREGLEPSVERRELAAAIRAAIEG